MKLKLTKAAILGASGVTGKFLAVELLDRGVAVRVVSRSASNLERTFPQAGLERVAADALSADETLRAVEGCDVVFDCIGLPADRMADHGVCARNIAAAVNRTGARCVQVSSFWAYLPQVSLRISENHPRSGGPFAVRMRREAEDILQQAGAAVVHLPDFYGPEKMSSTLQQALQEAAAGKTVNWIGSAKNAREYLYVPDGMKTVADLAHYPEAYGERWIVPGAGPISAVRAMEIASRHLSRKVKIRQAGPVLLRLAGLFNRQLRLFLPMAPLYAHSIEYNGAKLKGLLQELPVTPYHAGIPATLDWILRNSGGG